jgi:hypothetical protein
VNHSRVPRLDVRDCAANTSLIRRLRVDRRLKLKDFPMHMKIANGLLLVGLLIGCASAANVPAPAPPAPAATPPAAPAPPAPAPAPQAAGADQALTSKSSIDQVLDAMDARGQDLKDFTAAVKLTETDAALGTGIARTGRIWLQRRGEGNDRVRVLFNKRITDKGSRAEKIEYVLSDGWLLDRDYTASRQIRRQVLQPGQKINLLKLGEGPFPLPLGQSKEDVHRMFDVKKIDPAPGDPPNTIHLQLTPKSGTEFDDKFTTVDFWIDLSTRMPVRSETVDKNGTTIKTADLGDIKLNQDLGDADFTPEKIDPAKWTMREAPFNE